MLNFLYRNRVMVQTRCPRFRSVSPAFTLHDRMKMFRPLRLSLVAGLTSLVGVGAIGQAHAQSVATVPVGAVSVTVAAGNGASRAVTVLSFPLLENPQASGQVMGRITGVTANSITNSGASWVVGALSSASTPYLLQITSGTAKGSTFLISTATSNTEDTVFLDAEESSLVDLRSLGIVTGDDGDTYRLLPCDTLSSILGAPGTTGVQGGTSPSAADIVMVFVSGGWRQYYFNTNSSAWLRVTFNTNSNNVPIRPDSLVIYNRIAPTAMALTLTGAVPDLQRKVYVRNSGIIPVSTLWPTNITLQASGIHLIPGWVSSADSSVADVVQLFVSGGWRSYYHDGVNWKRVTFNTNSDSVVVATGSGVVINRRGSATGTSVLSQSLPYSL